MNDRNIEDIIKQDYGQEVLDSMQGINSAVNDVIKQINHLLSAKYFRSLGAESYYTTFACTLKTAFCDFFLEAMKNKSSKDRTAFLDLLLQDAREYISKRLKNNPTLETTLHPSE